MPYFCRENERHAQDSLAELKKLQLEHQMLKTEKDDLQESYEHLSVEKDRLQSKVDELETKNIPQRKEKSNIKYRWQH